MIAICPNPFRDTDCAISLKIAELVSLEGKESCICPVFADDEDCLIPAGITTYRLSDIIEDCELLIVVGGDGTILNVVHGIKNKQIPILGVNLGTKGFMAHLEPEELGYVSRAVRGEFKLSKRMKLDVRLFRDGTEIFFDQALNDAVMHGYGDCIRISALCDGNSITNYSGDGIIVSTPTGSTGYSMSAGGPIVEPNSENIIISPICAHMMSAKSFVVGPEREVQVNVEKLHDRRAYLAVDGAFSLDLRDGDVISVRRSENYALMADLGLRNFFEIAFKKLS